MSYYPDIKEMEGKTFEKVYQVDDDEIRFEQKDGDTYVFYHSQDCCETVYIEDVCGDLSDLEGFPLLQADEQSSNPSDEDDCDYIDSRTWTFYRFATIRGSVVVRWLGESNGYYSESVDLRKE